MISEREQNFGNGEPSQAEFEELESTPEDAATADELTQLHTETKAEEKFLNEALAEIEATSNPTSIASSMQPRSNRRTRADESGEQFSAGGSESESQPHELSNATTISDEIGAGFELCVRRKRDNLN